MPIFISYSQKDETLYLDLCDKLNQNNIGYWDTRSMRLAEKLSDQLRDAINKCDVCIYLATCNSVSSNWCLTETGAFWGADKIVIIYTADPDLKQEMLPPQFKGDLSTSDLQRVLEYIREKELKLPTHSASKLFFFSEGSMAEDESKIDVIKQTMISSNDSLISNLTSLDHENIMQWKSLFMAMPYREKFSESLIERLVNWVRSGGKLIITGFELGERHHQTNFNQLAYHFGISFRSDIIASSKQPSNEEEEEYEKINKGYDVALSYNINNHYNIDLVENKYIIEQADIITKGVSTIAMANTSSLNLEPGALPLVFAKPNLIKELKEGKYARDFTLAIGKQEFKPKYEDANRAVIALAPTGLTVKGYVLAMGTWDFRKGDKYDNELFLKNISYWMSN